MNLLAHMYLSGPEALVLVGNYAGDFVKGNPATHYQGYVLKGILLHREIDQFTDTHPTVRLSKERLRPRYRHYAPVITDIYYDHFLAKNWAKYHPQSLAQFAQSAYQTLQANKELLPQKAQQVLPYMVQGNWLVHYAQMQGIGRALEGMSRRTRFNSGMEHATQELAQHYEAFEKEFALFFPELQAHCQALLKKWQ